jgi:hypothetical protein
MQNLLINQESLKEKQISFYKINRGGDITYHGPGQVVVTRSSTSIIFSRISADTSGASKRQ